MADRRIENSRLLRQRLVRGSVHYASTPALANIPFNTDSSEDSGDSGHPFDYCDSSSVSNSSENGHYHKLFESRSTYLRKRRQTSDYSSEYSSTKSYPEHLDKPDVLRVCREDVQAIESAYRGHKTKVFVCESLANLYTCPKISTMSNTVSNWILTYTGVPVLLLDMGNTKARTRRQIQLLLVEKGTCFTLWRDIVDNLTRYTTTQDGLFHTFHLSTDHSVRLGLSFDSKEAAKDFHGHLLYLTSEPANIALSGPSVTATKTHYYLDNIPEKKAQNRKKLKYKPNKMDISQPCGFQHVVSVSQSDFKRYFSLQTFVDKINQGKQPVRKKKPPAPPPPTRFQPNSKMTSSVSCHNIYALQS